MGAITMICSDLGEVGTRGKSWRNIIIFIVKWIIAENDLEGSKENMTLLVQVESSQIK